MLQESVQPAVEPFGELTCPGPACQLKTWATKETDHRLLDNGGLFVIKSCYG